MALPGGPQMGWQLSVVINDSIVEIPCEPVIVRLQELVVACMPHKIGRPQAVHVPLACHITHHKAIPAGGPMTIHQLYVVGPAAMYVWPCVLSGKAAWHMLLCEACGETHRPRKIQSDANEVATSGCHCRVQHPRSLKDSTFLS